MKASEKELICVLPFIRNKSLQLRTRLVNSVENNLKFCKVKAIFKSLCKLSLLFRYKDSLKKEIPSDTVYRLLVETIRLLIIVKHTATLLLEL